jgi:hypothetical protein
MTLVFLTPEYAAIAALGLAAFAALLASERRAAKARGALGLAAPSPRSRVPTMAALVLVPALLGLALAQPVLRSTRTQRVRSDAEALFIFDTSRSMAASAGPGQPSRLSRALRAGLRLRLALADVPSGIATMTDRVLPDLFPTPSEESFVATLQDSVGIDRPPPRTLQERATTFAALDALEGWNFFDHGIAHRLAIVLTDGETAPYSTQELRSTLSQKPRTSFVILRFWRPGERIYRGETADPGYRPDPGSASAVAQLADVTGGQAFDERDVARAARAAREALGTGPVRRRGESLHVVPLARWLALAALAPLALLLWRRNVA